MLHGVCSSIGRASACDADGCGFESRHSPQGNVAESGLRHSTANREVLLKGPAGSNPVVSALLFFWESTS